MIVKTLKLTLNLEANISTKDAEKVRGFLGNIYRNNPYVHQHKLDGSLIYDYPKIQYKVIKNRCFLIGIAEGIDIIKKVFFDLDAINLDGNWIQILDKELEQVIDDFCILDDFVSYTILTPWLALNEKNYEKYQMMGMWEERKKKLEEILKSNIISISKSLGYTVPAPIIANIKRFKEVKTSLKGVPMLGFLGIFSVNFSIPDYWGIGKSVSRGFGTIKRIKDDKL